MTRRESSPACRSTRGRCAPGELYRRRFAASGSTARTSRRGDRRGRRRAWCVPRRTRGRTRDRRTPSSSRSTTRRRRCRRWRTAVRRESGTKVVAITGSAGKTTTKEVTSEFLEARYRVVRNRGNFNNHIGLPLSLIELRQRPEMAVVELGMNHAGEISTLVRVAEPDVRVWTNVGEAHLGFFASVDAIADAKAEILEGADRVDAAGGERRRRPRSRARIAAFRRPRRDVRDRVVTPTSARPRVVDRGIDGISARVTTPRGAFESSTPLVGRGNLANMLAATAVAVEFDVPLAAIADRAARLRPAAHRGEVVQAAERRHGRSTTATTRTRRRRRRALDVLAGDAGTARRDRGPRRDARARRHARRAARGRRPRRRGCRRRRAAGRRRRAGAGAGRCGRRGGDAAASTCATSRRATRPRTRRPELVQPGDLVLVKGSRGVRTDRVVDRLKAERG